MAEVEGKYRVGMVGCGRQGTQHARGFTLLAETRVVAIADPDPDNLALACRRFDARGYSSAEEMYANEELDIVDCVLPVRYNPDMVVLAAERSGAKGIVSEKPIAAKLSDADRMLEACRSRGIPWQGGTVDRSLSQMWEARSMIEAGEIGEVVSISMFHPITQCGAQTLSVGHMFAGDSEVEEVVGWTNGDPFGAGDEDYKGIWGHIRYANGVECFVHPRESAFKGLIVTGSMGVFVTDKRNGRFYKKVEDAGRDVLSGLQYDESIAFKSFRGHAEGGYDDEGWLYPGDRLMDSMRSIVEAIEQGIEPRASGTIQHRSLEVAMAMRESARRGSVPVRLPLEDRSLTLMPQRYRWDNKKLLHGEEWYAEQIGNATRW